MNSAFAFLDLLGFSEYVKSDVVGAARLLESQRHILQIKLGDAKLYAAKQAEVSDFAREHLISSFNIFLPFSDCIFVTSDTPDLFVRQLAHFLVEAFLFTGHAYAHPENALNPTAMDIRVIGATGATSEKHNWFPVLWRGGLSFGRVELLETAGLKQGEPFSVPLLVGPAVVAAVALEKTGKGPRLFCPPEFKTNLTDTALLPFFVPVPGKPCEEFLWPAFLYADHERPVQELSRTHELLLPAFNLWRAQQDEIVKEQYLQFIRLIGRSAMKWSECHGVTEQGRKFLRQQVDAFQLGELPADVFT